VLIDTKKVSEWIEWRSPHVYAALTLSLLAWTAHTGLTLMKEQVIATRKLVDAVQVQALVLGTLLDPKDAPKSEQDDEIAPRAGADKTVHL
jgi:hypothetical protein